MLRRHRNISYYPHSGKNLRYNPRFDEYELLRDAWLLKHPQHTPDEFREAMRRISAECGI